MIRTIALALMCVCTLAAQDRVASEFLYHRVWAVVPIVGKGTADDPKRPMFVDSPTDVKARVDAAQRAFQATGKKADLAAPPIISYTMQLTDDGKSAIVEFVGLNSQSLAFITTSKVAGVIAFERGKTTQGEIEAAFKKVKQDFTIDSLQPTAKPAVKVVAK